jgi:hypothetical protein
VRELTPKAGFFDLQKNFQSRMKGKETTKQKLRHHVIKRGKQHRKSEIKEKR